MSSWNRDFSKSASKLPWFFLLGMVFLLTLNARAQKCAGNTVVGCTHAGAACSIAGVPKGHCQTLEGLQPRERVCACLPQAPLPPKPPQPATVNPKYIVAAIVYAPPGCASITPNTPCSQPGLVDYSGGSSMGSKVTVANSFKTGISITATIGNDVTGGSQASFGWNHTGSDSKSMTLTKSSSLEIKAPGNGDGIDHDQDMFELLLNPTIQLTSNGPANVYWQPENPGARYEVYVSELRNPASMRPSVAEVLKQAGLTAADFKTIRCLDPFAAPGLIGGIRPDVCQSMMSTGKPVTFPDPNRFRPTTWILPYEPPLHPGDLCPSITATLKNDYVSEDAQSTGDEYSVSASADVGWADIFGVKLQNSITWTSDETDTSSQDSTQSASLTLVCPSVGYTGPTLFQVFVDVVYGTFVFLPFDPSTMSVIHNGTVLDRDGAPVAGAPVDFAYNGRTFHTFTTSSGRYSFIGLNRLMNPAMDKGTISIRNVKQQVTLQSKNPITLRLPEKP